MMIVANCCQELQDSDNEELQLLLRQRIAPIKAVTIAAKSRSIGALSGRIRRGEYDDCGGGLVGPDPAVLLWGQVSDVFFST